jgi:hypothetical protein
MAGEVRHVVGVTASLLGRKELGREGSHSLGQGET